MATRANGTLWVWGHGGNGRLGLGGTENRPAPVRVGTVTNWSVATAGSWHTVALREDGTLWAWGGNRYRQLGDGTTTGRTVPVRIEIFLQNTILSFSHVRSDTPTSSAVGFNNGVAGEFTAVHRWNSAQLNSTGVAGGLLTAVEFVGNVRAATYTVRVWRGGSGNPFYSGTLIAEVVVPANTIVERQWHTVRLPNPITIPTNQELWIGYHVNTPYGFPANVDGGPHFEGFGNLVHRGNEWLTMSAWGGHNNLFFNWMIRGIAEVSPRP